MREEEMFGKMSHLMTNKIFATISGHNSTWNISSFTVNIKRFTCV